MYHRYIINSIFSKLTSNVLCLKKLRTTCSTQQQQQRHEKHNRQDAFKREVKEILGLGLIMYVRDFQDSGFVAHSERKWSTKQEYQRWRRYIFKKNNGMIRNRIWEAAGGNEKIQAVIELLRELKKQGGQW